MRSLTLSIAAAVAAALIASAASAHVVLEKREAIVASYYKAVFQVGHGCNGSPTTGITVQIPDGVIAAKPMPKPGWTIALTKGRLCAGTRASRPRGVRRRSLDQLDG